LSGRLLLPPLLLPPLLLPPLLLPLLLLLFLSHCLHGSVALSTS